MTEEEKRQQKAMLLLEYQEAEENLAQLKEKLTRMSESFSEVSRWLSRANRSNHPGYVVEDKRTDANIRTSLEKYRKSLDFEEAVRVMDEFAKADVCLQQLSKRKADLGLK